MTGLQPELIKIEVFVDAKNCLDTVDKRAPPQTSTAYRNEMAVIKEFLDSNKVTDYTRISSEMQLADSLTKLGAAETDLLETLNKGKFFN